MASGLGGIILLAASVCRKGRAMKFTLLAIGKIKEKWMRQGIEEYVKRLKPIAPLEIIAQDEEKMPENPSPAMKERVMEKEGEKMLKYLSGDDCLVLLDLKGDPMSSEGLADWISRRMVTGTSHFYFMIGGPYGNGKNIQHRADLKISISAMTFTHQMARLILSEQLYRAMKVIGMNRTIYKEASRGNHFSRPMFSSPALLLQFRFERIKI